MSKVIRRYDIAQQSKDRPKLTYAKNLVTKNTGPNRRRDSGLFHKKIESARQSPRTTETVTLGCTRL